MVVKERGSLSGKGMALSRRSSVSRWFQLIVRWVRCRYLGRFRRRRVENGGVLALPVDPSFTDTVFTTKVSPNGRRGIHVNARRGDV